MVCNPINLQRDYEWKEFIRFCVKNQACFGDKIKLRELSFYNRNNPTSNWNEEPQKSNTKAPNCSWRSQNSTKISPISNRISPKSVEKTPQQQPKIVGNRKPISTDDLQKILTEIEDDKFPSKLRSDEEFKKDSLKNRLKENGTDHVTEGELTALLNGKIPKALQTNSSVLKKPTGNSVTVPVPTKSNKLLQGLDRWMPPTIQVDSTNLPQDDELIDPSSREKLEPKTPTSLFDKLMESAHESQVLEAPLWSDGNNPTTVEEILCSENKSEKVGDILMPVRLGHSYCGSEILTPTRAGPVYCRSEILKPTVISSEILKPVVVESEILKPTVVGKEILQPVVVGSAKEDARECTSDTAGKFILSLSWA